MARWPLRRPVEFGAHRRLRLLLRVAIAAGLGLVAVLGADLAILALGSDSHRAGFDDRRRGGSLVIAGGGRLPEEVRDRFVELAGGRHARIVVIPTAHPQADGLDPTRALDPWKRRGVASVRLLRARSRAEADDPAFAAPLAEATGVWLGGGHQSWLAATYAGTAVERQLRAVLDRGGAVGGTSAGAAVLTDVMILGGRAQAAEGRGLGLLPGAVVDQHFLRRNRVKRLLGILADHPDLVGLGVDERTALVVRLGDGHLSVVGESYVVACLPSPSPGPPRVEILKRGDQANLLALKASAASIASADDLDEALGAGAGP